MRRLGAKKNAAEAVSEPDAPASPAQPAEPTVLQPADPVGTAHGYLDGVIRGEAVGWCCRPGDPGTRLGVEVLIDGHAVSRGTADQMREAVASAGFGDGRYGFKVPLPEELDDGGSHRVRVRADGIFLQPSPSFAGSSPNGDADDPWMGTRFEPESVPTVTRAQARAAAGGATDAGVGQQRSAELRGYVDGIVGDELVGWVVDEADPGRTLAVEGYLEGVPVGQGEADLRRVDVGRRGYGERHGFRLKLPALLDDGEYTVEVRTVPDAWRVPLIADSVVRDAERTPIPGITLTEALVGGRLNASEALLGQDGWLFEWPGVTVCNILRGRQAMPATVFGRQRERLLERASLARDAGVTLIEAIIPSKLAVYREFLPVGLEVDDACRPADELAAVFRDENGLDLHDLTVALRQAKRHGAVFTSTGRDLTSLGGFSAYRAIAKEIAKSRPQIEPLTMDVLELGELEPVADTLAELPRVVWIGSRAIAAGMGADDEEQEGQPRLKRERLSAEYALVPDELVELAGVNGSLLRRAEPDRRADALVIHDGAAQMVIPFLAEHFDRTLIVGEDAKLAPLLEAFRPDVMIEVAAERSLLLM